MDIESVRRYCLSLPLVTEDSAFGDDYLLFRVGDKIFACISFEREDFLTVKCDADYAIELRDRYSGITPAWHWNKKYWIQMCPTLFNNAFVQSLIRGGYAEVAKKLTKRFKTEHPEICEIK